MELINQTPFLLERFAVFDKQGAETLVVMLKATYALNSGGFPEVAEKQDLFVPADTWTGDPGASSLAAAGDFRPPAPATGVTLTGHAVALRKTREPLLVAVKIGPLLQQAAVQGDRHWDSVAFIPRIVGPEPFDAVPLTWENAFGGADHSPPAEKDREFQPDNPVGKGLLARRTKRPLSGTPLPNIEHPRHLITRPDDRPPAIGFGPVAPSWMPRKQFAGTYDQKWQATRAPLLPVDFDDRFFLISPAGLSSPAYFKGGEPCVILGTTPEGRLEFSLPVFDPELRLVFPDHMTPLQPVLDHVHIDTDRRRLNLTWRAQKQVHERLELVQAIEARERGKGER